MAQITWRNINAPATGATSGNAAAGSNLLERGFSRIEDGLGQLVDNRQDRLKREYQTQYDANTRAALAEINGIQDLVGLSEARQGGLNIDAFKQRFGDAFDYDQVDKYLQGSEQRLRDQLTKTQQFETQQQTYRDKPEVDRLLGEINSLTPDGGFQTIDANRDRLYQAIRNSNVNEGAKNELFSKLSAQATSLEDRFDGERTRDRRIAGENRQDFAGRLAGDLVASNKYPTLRGMMGEFEAELSDPRHGFTGSEIMSAMQQLRDTYKSVNNLTEEELSELETATNSYATQVSRQLEDRTAKYQQDREALVVAPNRKYELVGTAEEPTKADIVQKLGERTKDGWLNWDSRSDTERSSVNAELDTTLNNAIERINLGIKAELAGGPLRKRDATGKAISEDGQYDKDAFEKRKVSAKDVPNHVLALAVDSVLTDSDGAIDMTKVEDKLIEYMGEYQRYLANKPKLAELDKQYKQDQRDAEDSVAAYASTIKGDIDNRKKLLKGAYAPGRDR